MVETEFWGAMSAPNLMVESSVEDVADLVAAISFHAGEVQRNPYHLRMPAWMQDNVRRGGEIVGGQGDAAPDFAFATLYGVRRLRHGRLAPRLPPRPPPPRHRLPQYPLHQSLTPLDPARIGPPAPRRQSRESAPSARPAPARLPPPRVRAGRG